MQAAVLTIHTMPYGSEIAMRLPNAAHEARPWRIREIAPDFTVEDVWALPVYGGAGDFPALLEVMATLRPADQGSPAVRLLFGVRWWLGRRLGWDEAAGHLPIPGGDEVSLASRVPEDLRGTTAGLDADFGLFAPLFRTDTEFAAELSNQTVHGVMHLAWVDRGDGRYQGQMAVYVKPRGPLGKRYMALIAPFRHRVVYPELMRQIERAWKTRVPQ
jgi:Protein of unknown function (DUF2867)